MIYDLLNKYIQESQIRHEENLDLNNLMFQRKYGLTMQLPDGWSYIDALVKVVRNSTEKVLIIFQSTVQYHSLHTAIGESPTLNYISWHEIYTGMQMSTHDVRYMQRAKAALMDAQLTFFINPPPLPELLDQVRGCTSGCLVVLSKGDGSV